MPTDHTPTRFTTLMSGAGAFTAGVIATAVVGSLITKGDFVFDTSDNAVPAVVVNTTDVMEFRETAVGVLQTLSGSRINVEPTTASGFVTIKSGAGTTATGGYLCIESKTGTMNICTASGGRLDCDTDSLSRCV